jgi:hypothetical protein
VGNYPSGEEDSVKAIVIPVLMVKLLLVAVAPGLAHAEIVIKRVSCKEANSTTAEIFRNVTGFNRYVTVQVTRDGCRPRSEDEARFYLNRINGTQTSVASTPLERNGKRTNAIHAPVAPGWRARLYFQRVDFGDNVSGTFDYVLEVD